MGTEYVKQRNKETLRRNDLRQNGYGAVLQMLTAPREAMPRLLLIVSFNNRADLINAYSIYLHKQEQFLLC